MTDDRFEELLRDAGRDYHRPPETPREALWERIAAERARRGEAKRVVLLRPWVWGLGVAALLALGVGIGRWTAPATPSPGPGATDGLAYRVAATQYLSRAEAFLTSFRADVRQGGVDARFAAQAGDLLTTTRLMLDSPAAHDATLRALLEELELVLVQIAHLGPVRAEGDELDFITQGMEQRGVLTKLRSAIPAGPGVGQTQGAL
ncbi:MAG: hypothetical protein ACREMJ_04640 [Gemmatimonadales bacterium]